MNDFRPSDSMSNTPLERERAIEAYKQDVDRTLLRENLKLTPDQRVRRLVAFLRLIRALRKAGQDARGI